MFRNTIHKGCLTVFFSGNTHPTGSWGILKKNGINKRVFDEDIKSMVLELLGHNSTTTYMFIPRDPKTSLGVKLPILVLLIKNLHKYFTFEVKAMKVMAAAWDSKKLLRFLDAVQKRPFLWDSTHEAATNYALKANEWKDIGLEFELSGFMAQYTFKKLRALAQKQQTNKGEKLAETEAWLGLKDKAFLAGVDLGKENTKVQTNKDDDGSKSESGLELSDEEKL